MSKIIQCLLALLHLGNNVSLLTMQTKDIVEISHEDNSIILNCTYQNDGDEEILDKKIRWQKQEGKEFKNLAMFSPPGGSPPNIVGELQDLYINRTELIAPDLTLAAVLIIKDPVCSDMGIYRCWIEYYDSKYSERKETRLSTVFFNVKATGPEKFVVSPNELEENESISLICSANVGRPRGNIQISKISQNSDAEEIIYTSNSSHSNTENCTEIVTVTYTVTRVDNGILFRCSSKNYLTEGPELSKDSSKISVTFGPDKTTIILTPNKSMYTVGESLTIQCITDSNPLPVLIWSFRSNETSDAKLIELSRDKPKLVFDNLQTTNSGTYICTGVNEGRSNFPNATSRVSVSVRKYHGCNQCRYIEICQQKNGEIVCIPNKWVPIAMVFMILSMTFAVSSMILIRYRKGSQETSASKNIHNSRSHSYDAPEDNGGGYSSPSDLNRTQEVGCPSSEDVGNEYSQSRELTNMQEHSLLLTHHNEPDGYTTTQDVVQYAGVQKRSTKDSQVSNDNVYNIAWN